MFKTKQDKGFTLIELIVVMAVIGILVLLAMPKLMGHTQTAKLRNIQYDVKVAETKMDEYLVGHTILPDTWEPITAESILATSTNDKLYDISGLTKNIAPGEYKSIPNDLKTTDIGSKLNGNFYVNDEGKVYYTDESAVPPVEAKISKYIFSSGGLAYLNNGTLYNTAKNILATNIEDAFGGYYTEIRVKFDDTHFGSSTDTKESVTPTTFNIKTIYNSIWGGKYFIKDTNDNLYVRYNDADIKVASNVKSILSYSDVLTGSSTGFSYLDNSDKLHMLVYDTDAYTVNSDNILNVGISYKSISATSVWYSDTGNYAGGYYLVDNLGNVYFYDATNTKLINTNISNVNMKNLNEDGSIWFVDSSNKIFYISDISSTGVPVISSKKDYLKDYVEVFEGNGFLFGTKADKKVYLSYNNGDTWSLYADFSSIE